MTGRGSATLRHRLRRAARAGIEATLRARLGAALAGDPRGGHCAMVARIGREEEARAGRGASQPASRDGPLRNGAGELKEAASAEASDPFFETENPWDYTSDYEQCKY